MNESNSKGKMLKLKEYRVEMGVFEFDVIGVIGDYEKMSEYVAWKFEEPTFNTVVWDKGYEARGKLFYRSGFVPILWLPKLPKTPREHATFAHEAMHAVFHLFEWANVPITRDTEEVFGHCLAHIIANLFAK